MQTIHLLPGNPNGLSNARPTTTKGADLRMEVVMNESPNTGLAIAAAFLLPCWILITPDAAKAYDYCRLDVTGHMTSCSFNTMEQCEATGSGIGGDCFRDPFLREHRIGNASPRTYLRSRRLGMKTSNDRQRARQGSVMLK